MNTERAFYLITYSLLTAGVILAAAQTPGMVSFEGGFNSLFLLHLVPLLIGLLISLWTIFRISSRWQIAGVAFTLTVILINCFLPISARDALVHHLAVPKMWLELGKMSQIPWHEWSYYPYLLQLAFTGFLKLQLAFLTPFYHLSYLIITAGMCGAYLENKKVGYGGFGALLLLTVPVCIKLGTVPLVDLGLLAFSTAAALCIARSLDKPSLWWLSILAGLSLGLASLTKFNGLLFCATCGAAFLIAIVSSKDAAWWQKLRNVLLLSLSGFVILIPYLIRNFVWTNDPIYPMFKGFFGNVQPALTVSLPPLLHRIEAYGESMLELALLPIRVFIFGKEGDPRYFDGLLSPLLLAGFLPLISRKKGSLGDRFGAISALLYLIIAVTAAGARVRYLAPLYGILVVGGLPFILEALKKTPLKRTAAAALLFIHFGYAALELGTLLFSNGVFQYLGKPDSDSYLRERYVEYSTIEWINKNIPPSQTVYLLYTGNKFYWFNGQVRSGGYYSGDEFARLIKNSGTSEDIYREIHLRGIFHLMTNDLRLITGFKGLLNPEELARWDQFVDSHLALEFNDRGYSVWRIKE